MTYSRLALTLLAASIVTPLVATELAALAEAAQTPAEHIRVSKQYRLRADSFEAKAQKHEAEARKLEARPRSAMAQKWPAMTPQPQIKERQLAMEARRAAKESVDLAERHLRLSVEALAEGPRRAETANQSGGDN